MLINRNAYYATPHKVKTNKQTYKLPEARFQT